MVVAVVVVVVVIVAVVGLCTIHVHFDRFVSGDRLVCASNAPSLMHLP